MLLAGCNFDTSSSGSCCIFNGGSDVGGSTGGIGGSTSGGGAEGSIQLSWVFADPTGQSNGLSCAEVGAATIAVTLEGKTLSFPCAGSAGTPQMGVIAGVQANTSINFTANALATNGNAVAAELDGSFFASTGQTTSASLTFFANATTANLEVSWSFGSLTCVQAGVTEVEVDLGEQYAAAFPCEGFGDGGMQGDLTTSLGATEVAVVGYGPAQGNDAGIAEAWSGSASVDLGITGQSRSILLQSSAAENASTASLSWSFAGGLSCADVGASMVWLSLQAPDAGDAGFSFACLDDAGTMGATVTALKPGAYGFQLLTATDGGAYGAGGLFWANGTSDAVVSAELNPPPALDLGTDAGALDLAYLLPPSTSCDDGGATTFEVMLFDQNGAPNGDLTVPCFSTPILFPTLAPGVYTAYAQASYAGTPLDVSWGASFTVTAGAVSSYSIPFVAPPP